MLIFYIAATYPKEWRNEKTMVSPAYKFNKVLAEGLAELKDIHVRCYVPYVILKTRSALSQGSTVVQNGVEYVLIRSSEHNNYYSYMKAVVHDIASQSRDRESVILCDALSINGMLICFGSKILYGIKNTFIITDLPQFISSMNKKNRRKIVDKLILKMMKCADAYVLLTEQMSELLNSKRKPESIIEGFCDKHETEQLPELSVKYPKLVCMYAGSLHREYGIDKLIEAFVLLNRTDCELHVYGSGNYETEIRNICNRYSNVFFGGVRSNEFILQEERKASLLINPRPSDAEYTKYSFPSKTLEYMASGTPVLMTKLPSLPDEYIPYIYLIETESIEGYKEALETTISQGANALLEKGKQAQLFVRMNKTGVSQGEKICKDLNWIK